MSATFARFPISPLTSIHRRLTVECIYLGSLTSGLILMCPVKNDRPKIYAIYAHMQFVVSCLLGLTSSRINKKSP